MMRKTLLALTLVVFGCTGTGAIDTSEKASVAFCSSFASVLTKLALFRSTGNLSANDIVQIDNAILVIEPFCTNLTVVGEPTDAVIQALDVLLLLQLNQGVKSLALVFRTKDELASQRPSLLHAAFLVRSRNRSLYGHNCSLSSSSCCRSSGSTSTADVTSGSSSSSLS